MIEWQTLKRPPTYVEWLNDDGQPTTYFVDASDEEVAEIEAWLENNHAEDDPYVGPVVTYSFADFKSNVLDDACPYPGCLGPDDGSECRHPREDD